MKENLSEMISDSLRSRDDCLDFILTHNADIRARDGFVLWPEQCAKDPTNVANTMIDILSKNYGTHNIASNASALAADIENGNVKPFLRFDNNGRAVACAALVKINDSDVELGRAACIPGLNGGNGGLMVTAFIQWQENILFPQSKILRAEVRTAKPTKEVPGGQATQSICLNKIGFRPTAMMPMFHHGIPDRQEIFLLSSIHKKNIGVLNTNKIPEVVGDDLEKEVFGVFWRKFFGSKPVFTDVKITEAPIPNLEAVVRGPIVEITNSATPNNIWEAVDNFFNENGRFALARLSLDLPPDQLSMASIQLRKTGFRLAGFEPVIKKDDISMDILFGKLSNEGKRVMVLPTLTEGVFTHEEESLLIKQSIIWRQN